MKKHNLFALITSLALILALAVGAMALAESTDDTATEAATQETTTIDTETDDTALHDALTAYAEAKQAAHLKKLRDELNQYVADGSLTQEQADLVLDYYTQPHSTAPSHGVSKSRTDASNSHTADKGSRNSTANKGTVHSRNSSGKTVTSSDETL